MTPELSNQICSSSGPYDLSLNSVKSASTLVFWLEGFDNYLDVLGWKLQTIRYNSGIFSWFLKEQQSQLCVLLLSFPLDDNQQSCTSSPSHTLRNWWLQWPWARVMLLVLTLRSWVSSQSAINLRVTEGTAARSPSGDTFSSTPTCQSRSLKLFTLTIHLLVGQKLSKSFRKLSLYHFCSYTVHVKIHPLWMTVRRMTKQCKSDTTQW